MHTNASAIQKHAQPHVHGFQQQYVLIETASNCCSKLAATVLPHEHEYEDNFPASALPRSCLRNCMHTADLIGCTSHKTQDVQKAKCLTAQGVNAFTEVCN